MLYHQVLAPFKVLSFDLDDTLYDNVPVMLRAEQEFLQHLKQATKIEALDATYWKSWKNKVYQQDPILCENVTLWRWQAMELMLQYHQKNAQEIQQICQQAMAIFFQWRHHIQVPAQSMETLEKLKNYYPLVAFSNGNVDPQRLGFHCFDLVLRGGEDGRAKPHSELFLTIAKHYQVLPQEILHVGDNLVTDIEGAIKAGCQAAWVNITNAPFPKSQKEIPNIEIKNITELLALV